MEDCLEGTRQRVRARHLDWNNMYPYTEMSVYHTHTHTWINFIFCVCASLTLSVCLCFSLSLLSSLPPRFYVWLWKPEVNVRCFLHHSIALSLLIVWDLELTDHLDWQTSKLHGSSHLPSTTITGVQQYSTFSHECWGWCWVLMHVQEVLYQLRYFSVSKKKFF